MANHFGTLGFPAGECARGTVKGQVAQPDLDKRVQQMLQRGKKRRDGRVGQRPHPVGEVADLHLAGIRDADPADLR